MLTHTFKYTVTALAVIVCYSLPVAAATLDELFQELGEADAQTHDRIEAEIIAEWEKSGSASLDLLLHRGQDALLAGDPELALEHFSALVDHDPAFAEAYNARAAAYYGVGLLGPSLDDLRMTLVLNPRHFGAMQGVAAILEGMERPAEALEVYQTILQINPLAGGVAEAVERLQLDLEGQAL